MVYKARNEFASSVTQSVVDMRQGDTDQWLLETAKQQGISLVTSRVSGNNVRFFAQNGKLVTTIDDYDVIRMMLKITQHLASADEPGEKSILHISQNLRPQDYQGSYLSFAPGRQRGGDIVDFDIYSGAIHITRPSETIAVNVGAYIIPCASDQFGYYRLPFSREYKEKDFVVKQRLCTKVFALRIKSIQRVALGVKDHRPWVSLAASRVQKTRFTKTAIVVGYERTELPKTKYIEMVEKDLGNEN